MLFRDIWGLEPICHGLLSLIVPIYQPPFSSGETADRVIPFVFFPGSNREKGRGLHFPFSPHYITPPGYESSNQATPFSLRKSENMEKMANYYFPRLPRHPSPSFSHVYIISPLPHFRFPVRVRFPGSEYSCETLGILIFSAKFLHVCSHSLRGTNYNVHGPPPLGCFPLNYYFFFRGSISKIVLCFSFSRLANAQVSSVGKIGLFLKKYQNWPISRTLSIWSRK